MIDRLAFTVEGTPPIKMRGSSMWASLRQLPRLVRLRQAAYQALNGAPPFVGFVRLTLVVYLPTLTKRQHDVDTLQSGIFDGLQAATTTTHLAQGWAAPEYAPIHPSIRLVLLDDSQIISVRADKAVADTRRYDVLIEAL